MTAHIQVIDLNVWYGSNHVLKNVSVTIPANGITVVIGPSGCGKTTFLRGLNRLLEEDPNVRLSGQILLNGTDIYDPGIEVFDIRARVGLLAPKPFPLPMSIYDNVAYGPRILGRPRKRELDKIIENNLRLAGLWDEVADRLKTPAFQLSTGQQQRLCLARALAVQPEVLLCDEATSALDPLSAQGVESRLLGLKEDTTIVLVTHMLRQAHRLADHLIFFWLGELVEAGPAAELLSRPRDERTRAYLAGDIG
jgi:phosphate transport system ATP-binding protein